MEKVELLKQTKEKIDEIDKRINEFKQKVADQSEGEIKTRAEAALRELRAFRDKIQEQYDELEERKEEVSENVTEAEKNIYAGIETFEDAFTKAGSIFKTNQ